MNIALILPRAKLRMDRNSGYRIRKYFDLRWRFLQAWDPRGWLWNRKGSYGVRWRWRISHWPGCSLKWKPIDANWSRASHHLSGIPPSEPPSYYGQRKRDIRDFCLDARRGCSLFLLVFGPMFLVAFLLRTHTPESKINAFIICEIPCLSFLVFYLLRYNYPLVRDDEIKNRNSRIRS